MPTEHQKIELPFEPRTNLINIETIVPTEWIGTRQKTAVVIVCYEVQGITESQFRPTMCDLKEQVRVILFKGGPRYREPVKVTNFWVNARGELSVAQPEPSEVVTAPNGLYALFVSPYTAVDGSNQGELPAAEKIDIAAALFGSFQGRNIIFKKVYSNTYSFETQRGTSSSESIPVPTTLPKPAITREGIEPILIADELIAKLNERMQNRVRLSLRWTLDAIFDMGVNAFLKYWFALETIAMPSGKIYDLENVLRAIYGLPSNVEVRKQFHTELLYRLRGRIVHIGRIVPIHSSILMLLQHMHHDVLLHVLGMPSERRVQNLLQNSNYNYSDELQKLTMSDRRSKSRP